MLTSVARAAKNALRPIIHRPLHKPEIKTAYVVYGSEYGGWPLIDGTMNEDSVVYSFGVGEDITFDLAINQRFGCRVDMFDPTTKSKGWIECQVLPSGLHFHPYGLASSDGEIEFFPPANPNHVSFSSQPGKGQSNTPIIGKVFQLSSLMRMLDRPKVDVVKMDIEGFEYPVIESLLSEGILPNQLLVEFHHRMYGLEDEKTHSSVAALRKAGYKIFYVSAIGREYGFVRDIL